MRLEPLNAEQFLADRPLAVPWRGLSGKSNRPRVAIVGSAVKPRFDNVRLRGMGSRGEAHRGAGNDWDFSAVVDAPRPRPSTFRRQEPGVRSFPPAKVRRSAFDGSRRKDHTRLLTANGALGNYLRREPRSVHGSWPEARQRARRLMATSAERAPFASA